MKNLDFIECLKSGNVNVIYTDWFDGTEYIHTILKAGKKEVTLLCAFGRKYRLGFRNTDFYSQYKIIN
jgi:hypothetical protein